MHLPGSINTTDGFGFRRLFRQSNRRSGGVTGNQYRFCCSSRAALKTDGLKIIGRVRASLA
jgi:hypothetical protein